jgi:FlaA1/EpsC-like NDP-sugar epimerase
LARWDIPDVRERRVLVFGAGAAGQGAVRFLRRVAPGRIVGIVDNDPAKQGLQIDGLTVTRFEKIDPYAYDVVVIASLPGLRPISEQLSAAGLIPNQDFLSAGQVEQWHTLVTQYERLAA